MAFSALFANLSSRFIGIFSLAKVFARHKPVIAPQGRFRLRICMFTHKYDTAIIRTSLSAVNSYFRHFITV